MEEELPRVGKPFRIAGLLARDRAFSGSAVRADYIGRASLRLRWTNG
jgi:hypothetical protein